jgi:hypothetical protein
VADYTTREVTTTVKEVVLPSPTNWGELGKAMAYCRAQLETTSGVMDDTVVVEARDDEIVLWYRINRMVDSAPEPF